MARYHTQQHRQPAKPPAQPLKQWMWVLGAFVSGYFLSAVYDVASFNRWLHTTVIEGYFNKHAAVVLTKAPEAPPKPKFEFYTLLAKGEPEMEQEVERTIKQTGPVSQAPSTPVSMGTAPAEAPAASKATASALASNVPQLDKPPVTDQPDVMPVQLAKTVQSAEHYTVQLAAFNNRVDAEKMKAALALKGFSVNIAVVEQNHIQWFRVNLGPFSNRGDAEEAQHAMAKRERISGMIRKASA